MKLRKIENGVHICPEIRLDAPFDTHNGIATYLATDEKVGNTLVSMIPAADCLLPEQLDKTVEFYRDVLHLETRWGKYEEFIYFSEPFPFGEYLYEWLERRERVPLIEAIKRIISLLRILQQAHERGLYHGRLTPNTVLLERTGDTFDLRMMCLGISQLLPESRQLDINWLDFTINLKGMTPQSVDIYGLAIVLMGLVSGEQGIGSFEATGLLPPILREGHLQQTMERALALRVDAYTDVLSFSLDLEAALLELDERQGEVYVGDLVGFESAVKSLASISEDGQALTENTGVWSSLVDNLEQEARSSLLCSLTSLTAIRVDEGADEEVTRVSSIPESVLHLRRIHSSRPEEKSDKTVADAQGHEERTVVTSGRPSKIEKSTDSAPKVERPKDDKPKDDKPKDASQAKESDDVSADKVAEDAQPLADKAADADSSKASAEQSAPQPESRAADQDSQSEFEDEDEAEDDDDAPTRVMMRPNYESIRFSQESAQGVRSAIQEVLEEAASEFDAKSQMVKRIRDAEVIVSQLTLAPNVVYDPNDLMAFPFDPDLEAKENAALEAIEAENKQKNLSAKRPKSSHEPTKGSGRQREFTGQQRFILCTLTLVVLILIVIAIILLINRFSQP